MAHTQSIEAVSAPGNPTKCYFTSIAAELRNKIYDEIFIIAREGVDVAKCVADNTKDSANMAKAPVMETGVDLLGTRPPEKAMIMTCKQIHKEARGLYKTAYQRFWRETQFCLLPWSTTTSEAEFDAICKAIQALKAKNVAKIRLIRIFCAPFGQICALKDGFWSFKNGRRYLFYPADPKIYQKVRPCMMVQKSSELSQDTLGFFDVRGRSLPEIQHVRTKTLERKCDVTRAELLALVRLIEDCSGHPFQWLD